ADIAADVGGVAALQDSGKHGRRGGFSLGAGDAENGGGATLDEQANFGGDGDAGCAGGLKIKIGGGKGGRSDDKIRGGEVLLAVLAEVVFDVETFKLFE